MDYREFVNVMKNQVQMVLGEEVEVEVYEAVKNNEVKRVGLVLKSEQIPVSPTVYMEEFHNQYSKGATISELVKSIERLYQRVKVTDSQPYIDILDYQKIKSKIAYKLINKKQNRKNLRDTPYKEFFDMVMVPYVMFENSDFGYATMQIREEHLESWGVDSETVLQDAMENSEHLLPAELSLLTECMCVITNVTHSMGASAICYPGVLERVGEMLKENFYILPSSIHEFIAIPESFAAAEDYLKKTVREINQTAVAAEEILSNEIYYYNLSKGEMYQK